MMVLKHALVEDVGIWEEAHDSLDVFHLPSKSDANSAAAKQVIATTLNKLILQLTSEKSGMCSLCLMENNTNTPFKTCSS